MPNNGTASRCEGQRINYFAKALARLTNSQLALNAGCHAHKRARIKSLCLNGQRLSTHVLSSKCSVRLENARKFPDELHLASSSQTSFICQLHTYVPKCCTTEVPIRASSANFTRLKFPDEAHLRTHGRLLWAIG